MKIYESSFDSSGLLKMLVSDYSLLLLDSWFQFGLGLRD